MAVSVPVIFLISLALNFFFRRISPYLGAYRRGFDTVVFCAITTGYIGGINDGAIYGILIAIAYYIWRSKQWGHALFVIPLAGLTGALTGMFNNHPYLQIAAIMFGFYHIVSALMVTTVYKTMGFRYITFMLVSFVTTFILFGITSHYI